MADETREDVTPVVLVDRAMTGGFEFLHDGRPYVFEPGEIKLTVGADVARHVFRHQHTWVWTTTDEYVQRLAVENAPGFKKVAERLAHELGNEILDQSPIEIATRPEGWDTREADRGRVAYVPVNIPSTELRDRQGSASGVTFAERK